MGKTLLILIDAFRFDYVSKKHTPFLWSLSKNGHYIQKLEPSFGFCERTEIFVGKASKEFNYFTAIAYNPNMSPYKKYSFILNILSKFTHLFPTIINRIFNRVIWEIMSRTPAGFPRAAIPVNLLKYFALTEDGLDSAIRHDKESLYQLSKKDGWGINDKCFTSLDAKQFANDEVRINHISKVLEGDDLLNMLFISECDKIGHQYGPDSPEMVYSVKKIDAKMKKLYEQSILNYPDLNVIFCGDHGMTKVTQKINIFDAVSQELSEYDLGKDYVVFIDSTLFRVWSLNPKYKNDIDLKLKSLFKKENFSSVGYLTTPEKLGYKNDRLYGDWIWVARPGILILNDYFSPAFRTIEGMHGYETHNQSYGMSIGVGPAFLKKQTKKDKLTAVYDMLLKSLEVKSNGDK